VGSGEWGVGSGEWGMGKIREIREMKKRKLVKY
jgi:hypothetical protein